MALLVTDLVGLILALGLRHHLAFGLGHIQAHLSGDNLALLALHLPWHLLAVCLRLCDALLVWDLLADLPWHITALCTGHLLAHWSAHLLRYSATLLCGYILAHILGHHLALLLRDRDLNLLALSAGNQRTFLLRDFFWNLSCQYSWDICAHLASQITANIFFHSLLKVFDNPAAFLNFYRGALLFRHSLGDCSTFGRWLINAFLLSDNSVDWFCHRNTNILRNIPADRLGYCSAYLARNLATVAITLGIRASRLTVKTSLLAGRVSSWAKVAILSRKAVSYGTGAWLGSAGVMSWRTEDAVLSWGTFSLGAGASCWCDYRSLWCSISIILRTSLESPVWWDGITVRVNLRQVAVSTNILIDSLALVLLLNLPTILLIDSVALGLLHNFCDFLLNSAAFLLKNLSALLVLCWHGYYVALVLLQGLALGGVYWVVLDHHLHLALLVWHSLALLLHHCLLLRHICNLCHIFALLFLDCVTLVFNSLDNFILADIF